MTEMYKGQRISDLLQNIGELQNTLETTKHMANGAEEVLRTIEAEATLAIMKAKLTALQGEK